VREFRREKRDENINFGTRFTRNFTTTNGHAMAGIGTLLTRFQLKRRTVVSLNVLPSGKRDLCILQKSLNRTLLQVCLNGAY